MRHKSRICLLSSKICLTERTEEIFITYIKSELIKLSEIQLIRACMIVSFLRYGIEFLLEK